MTYINAEQPSRANIFYTDVTYIPAYTQMLLTYLGLTINYPLSVVPIPMFGVTTCRPNYQLSYASFRFPNPIQVCLSTTPMVLGSYVDNICWFDGFGWLPDVS